MLDVIRTFLGNLQNPRHQHSAGHGFSITSLTCPLVKDHYLCGSEQGPIWKVEGLWCLKAPVLWQRSDKAHLILYPIYQSAYQALRSVFRHQWISPIGTWLGFLERLGLFSTNFHSSLVPRSCKTIKWVLKTLLRECKQYEIIHKKQTIGSAASNSETSKTWLLLYAQFISTMKRRDDSTNSCRSPTPTVNSCDLMHQQGHKLLSSKIVTWLASNRQPSNYTPVTLPKAFYEGTVCFFEVD